MSMKIEPDAQRLLDRAKRAIDRDESIIYDIAADKGQQVDNVKHTSWFLREVCIRFGEDYKKWEIPLSKLI